MPKLNRSNLISLRLFDDRSLTAHRCRRAERARPLLLDCTLPRHTPCLLRALPVGQSVGEYTRYGESFVRKTLDLSRRFLAAAVERCRWLFSAARGGRGREWFVQAIRPRVRLDQHDGAAVAPGRLQGLCAFTSVVHTGTVRTDQRNAVRSDHSFLSARAAQCVDSIRLSSRSNDSTDSSHTNERPIRSAVNSLARVRP